MRQGKQGWLAALAAVALVAAAGAVVPGTAAAAGTPAQLDLKVLLVGGTGGAAADPTTAAWASALSTEGVAYTEVDASGAAGSETVALPALSGGTHGYFNGVVVADSPTDLASGQLTALDAYESAFGVRQVDGYSYPNPALGLTDTSAGALDGTSGTLTAAGLRALPELKGTIPFGTGSYGYPASAVAGAPVTPWLENSSGGILAAVYQHPATDPQAGVAELSLGFDYNAAQTQWLLLAPGLIDWVTDGLHLGLYRNYVEMDIDDTFTPDDAWDTANHTIDYSDADALRMRAADVDYAAKWSQANDFRMDQLFNGGGSAEYQANNSGTDPVLAEFQKADPATGKPYADDFGWLSHTYDTPYLDVGCASQNYIEAELNENTSWAAAKPGGTPGTGGLGLTSSTDAGQALGYENPQVFVPGNHSGFADLVPGNPATVDPPDLDQAAADSGGGTLAAGSYEYAVTDQFTDSSSAGQSAAYVTAPISVPAGGSVTLQMEAICHAADYQIYREVAGSGDWSLIDTYATPFSSTLPDNSSGDPTSTTDVSGGGEKELSYTDTGAAGTARPGWTPPTTENAVEGPWEQNPYFVPALEAVGITVVGDDASKVYPNPPDDQFGIGADYSGSTYAAAQPFVDGTAQVAPRHPINIYYNASTEAQEVDEYNTLYEPPSLGGQCVASSTTTCETAPATFADIVDSVVSGMLQNMLSNDPRPSYVHQTNIIGQPPAGPATSGTPPTTADTTGDGLLYSVLNPLLSEYAGYFSSLTPYEQPTLGAIGTVLAQQTAWSAAQTAGSVTASETDGAVTVANSGTSSVQVPITAPTGTTVNGAAFGQAYGGTLSAWTPVAGSGSTTLQQNTAPTVTSAATAAASAGVAFSTTVTTTGAPAPALKESGALPSGVTFTDNGDGTATLAGTPAAGSGGSYPLVLTATNASGSAVQDYTLTVSQTPVLTSAATAAFSTGTAGTYPVTTSGYPAPALTESGALPTGLTFTDNGNGTGSVSGTAAAGTAGSYPVTLTATNVNGSGTLGLTITVSQSTGPVITSAATQTLTTGTAGTLTVTTTGSAPITLTESGTLPSGVTFKDNGNGTATLAGTPAAGTGGVYPLTLTAKNAVGSTTQALALTVNQPPAFTTANSATALGLVPFSFTVKTTGYPAAVLSESGALPSGLTFTPGPNGTATISGSTLALLSSYKLTFTAKSAAGTATQAFTLSTIL
jgi:Putative Ig domain